MENCVCSIIFLIFLEKRKIDEMPKAPLGRLQKSSRHQLKRSCNRNKKRH